MKKITVIILAVITEVILMMLLFPSFSSSTEETKKIYTEIVGNIRIQFYSDSVIRLENKGSNGFCDAKTLAVVNRSSWEGASVTKTESDDTVTLKTAEYTVSVPKNAAELKNVAIMDNSGNSVWTYDPIVSAKVYLPDPADTPAAWCFNDSPRVCPNENGFSAPSDSSDYEENNGWTYENSVNDFYVFLTGGDSLKLRADFVKLTGSADLIPIKTLGLWFSRWHAYRSNQVLDLIDEYRKRGYPIDMVVCDTDWRSSTDGTGYKINRSCFPNVEDFFKNTSEKNVDILFNDHIRASSKSMMSFDQLSWFNTNLNEKLNQGLSAWWFDRNWTNKFVSPFKGINGDMLGQYLYLWVSQSNASQSERPFLLSNIYWILNGTPNSVPYVSSHNYGIQWTGDIDSTYDSLENELKNMVWAGAVSSTAYISSDIGGFNGAPDELLFIRWTQYGALSPIMRYHSAGTDRSPWTVGEKADEVANAYINMRYRLLPLFYTLSYQNYTDGLPIARRLDFYYPQYEQSKNNNQYMLGEDIIVAPYYSSDQKNQTVPKSWFSTDDGTSGLTGSYYNNKTMTGTPKLTKTDANINFDWGQSAPGTSVNADNFSVVWKGKITIGDTDASLGVISDDGVRVYIDDELIIDNWKASDSVLTMSDKTYKAGTAHTIKIEYFDNTGGAKIQLLYGYGNRYENTDTREVFIPDGTWLNAFSGEKITGPQTVSVSLPISQSPIFIKEGSLTVLAKPGESADTQDWSNLTLDIYTEDNKSDTTSLYEDDGISQDYKSSKYRLTEYSINSENGMLTLNISPENKGYKASFDQRTYNVRIHGMSQIKNVTCNGQNISFSTIEQNKTAMPFAIEEGSPDGDIVTLTFTAGADEKVTIKAADVTADTSNGFPVYLVTGIALSAIVIAVVIIVVIKKSKKK